MERFEQLPFEPLPFEQLQELWRNQPPPLARVPDAAALTREFHRYGRKRSLINLVKAVVVLWQIVWMLSTLRGDPLALTGAIWIAVAEIVFLILDWRRQMAIAGMNFTEPSLGFVAHAMARLCEDRLRFRRQWALLVCSAAGGINLMNLGSLHGSVSHRIGEHLEGTAMALVAWRLGLWLREKRDRAERRPLIAQLTAMERALKALKEGAA
ncbi:MAG TPA: hypothetical protein VNY05_31630 [Candidatus Acidoferrales bacterium]|jgi:hypothetical protein|nr:hypothetical protein [Candidatus Acidoferrales bacterium]